MIDALEIYLAHLARSGDHEAAVVSAAEALSGRPWSVVQVAGRLARCRVEIADRDLGLTRRLGVTSTGGAEAVVWVEEGQPYPVPVHAARRRRGVADPPIDVARRVVRSAMAVVEGALETVLDPACGAGAFLVAAAEAGIPEVYGMEQDPLLLRVAQIAVPHARLLQEDPLKHGPPVDLVVGAPPFVDPSTLDARKRWELRRRYPWLGGRVDLAAPFAAAAVQRTREGGATGLVLPASMLTGLGASTLRRRWLERHRFAELSAPHSFPEVDVPAALVVLGVRQVPGPLPVFGLHPDELLLLEKAPLNPDLMPGDVELVRHVRASSVPLGSVALVDSGMIIEGPNGGGDGLIFEEPGEGRVPLADAQQFFTGRRSWLAYLPNRLHKPKAATPFERPKVVVQRLRGRGPVRAGVDIDGTYVDHSCTMVVPEHGLSLERVLEVVRSPLADAVTRVEVGERFDLYPRELALFPFPKAFLFDATITLEDAWELSASQVQRLKELARF